MRKCDREADFCFLAEGEPEIMRRGANIVMAEQDGRGLRETVEEEFLRKKGYWDRYIESGEIDPGLNPVIARSWEKCRAAGTSHDAGKGKVIDKDVFRSILNENRELIDIAIPIMQSVYDIINDSGFFFVLTDSVGYVLETMGDSLTDEMQDVLNFKVGALWSDLQVGSNAIGIALDYDTPIQTMGAEHFCRVQHGWTCSAAPIHGMNGELVGCIDLSCDDYRKKNPHTLGLVVAAAFSIEGMLKQKRTTKLLHSTLNESAESIVVLDEQFEIVFANRSLQTTFHVFAEELKGVDFRTLAPDVDWDNVAKQTKGDNFITYNTRMLFDGKEYHCGMNISMFLDRMRNYVVTIRHQERMIHYANRYTGNVAQYHFEDILAVDPLMLKTIALARRYARYDGIVLIEGESGTGKELFAPSIHNESRRAEGPFVAVNCASLPRDLLESEMFGYEKGAFTGARKEGNPGKFELANHGTLFLDEIGEMPLEFQAKLLRAVETLCIRRIGGRREIRLDVRIIAATNRDLRRESERGNFRKDLYYRLNVLRLVIPPLRDRRADIVYDARVFLDNFNRNYPEQSKEMDAGFCEALEAYQWPGNVRELQNGIERTFYAASGKRLVRNDFVYITGVPSVMEGTETGREGEDPVISERDRAETDQIRKLLEDALERSGYDAEKAAELLSMSRATFYRRCRRCNVSPKHLARNRKNSSQ